jgi:hypothetical protein
VAFVLVHALSLAPPKSFSSAKFQKIKLFCQSKQTSGFRGEKTLKSGRFFSTD